MRLRLLLGCAVLPLVLWALLPVFSQGAASPEGRLHELQRKISITQGKIGRRKGTERLLTTQITAYSRRINRLQSRIGTLQNRQAEAQADLDAKRAELFKIQADLRAERRRLVRLRARLAQARTALAQRLVELYQADEPDIVTVVLSSHGFTDLLERGEFMQRVSEQDQRIIEIVRDAKAEATATAKRLDLLEHRQQHLTQLVQQRRDQIAGTKMELIGTKVGLAHTRADKAHALVGVRADRQQLEGNLSGLKKEQNKIQATLQQSQGNLPAGPIKHGNGSLIWPVNGPITSPFCERRAWEACHPGMDIGVPSGTPIRAAAAGRVALVQSAGASGGYGNFTCIQHTGALSTCYAHQSSIGVSVGESVSQGQVIGYSGCTGLCFGPHLHFEVRINGAVTNPLNYL
ncbi:MAG TPA: peptidoglycan DD-metalloendopeptidase family protein [Candidatus Dormibacteraeota bacterium]|nr:peptidoglycan DD-metalloendopeptidase family protein [Candidatus Dormibacteraeota bacterium]